jgi:hypothetical protein
MLRCAATQVAVSPFCGNATATCEQRREQRQRDTSNIGTCQARWTWTSPKYWAGNQLHPETIKLHMFCTFSSIKKSFNMTRFAAWGCLRLPRQRQQHNPSQSYKILGPKWEIKSWETWWICLSGTWCTMHYQLEPTWLRQTQHAVFGLDQLHRGGSNSILVS